MTAIAAAFTAARTNHRLREEAARKQAARASARAALPGAERALRALGHAVAEMEGQNDTGYARVVAQYRAVNAEVARLRYLLAN